MPNLVLESKEQETMQIPLRMTGTDGVQGVPPGVPTGGAKGHRTASIGNFRVIGAGGVESTQPVEMKGAGASQHRPASIGINEGDGGRTRNLRSDSPPATYLKRLKFKAIARVHRSVCRQFA